MCGLVGIALTSKTSVADRNKLTKSFKQLLYVDSLRGEHSTGIAVLRRDKDGREGVSIAKAAIAGYNFVNTKLYTDTVTDTDNMIYIGHNRFATVGAHTAENAHPFSEGNITLAHNGTVRYCKGSIPLDVAKVDSHCITMSMAKIGEQKTLGKLNGAFALTWFNAKDKSLNIAKNSERTLSIFRPADKSWIAWASEEAMLGMVLARNGLLYHTFGENKGTLKGEFVTPKNLVHYKIDTRTLGTRAYEFEELVPPPLPRYNYNNTYARGSADWDDNWRDDYKQKKKKRRYPRENSSGSNLPSLQNVCRSNNINIGTTHWVYFDTCSYYTNGGAKKFEGVIHVSNGKNKTTEIPVTVHNIPVNKFLKDMKHSCAQVTVTSLGVKSIVGEFTEGINTVFKSNIIELGYSKDTKIERAKLVSGFLGTKVEKGELYSHVKKKWAGMCSGCMEDIRLEDVEDLWWINWSHFAEEGEPKLSIEEQAPLCSKECGLQALGTNHGADEDTIIYKLPKLKQEKVH